jgi:hypothetical protein
MPLEDADYLGELDPASPKSGEPKVQGDNHLRLLKKALRQTFPGFSGAVLLGGAATGPADAYVLSPATPLPNLVANMMVVFKPSATNITVAPTVNISGLGAVPIKSVDGTPVLAGDLVAGQYVAMMYTGSFFALMAVTKNYINQLQFSSSLPGQPGGTESYSLVSTGGAATWQLRTTLFTNQVSLAQLHATALSF